ncbi:bifunctional riboflavin kinase/FAD synthetase [Methyloceanibacter sp.]|uniref:bifunctional riboflavin kinase/FAD synthetase n=1 Tax=Methyloceanibacter sp. TaxID=1965321 RepID=UPI002D57DA16|nr:bifunctional riboflavin kinase/FAD synthetase [Methyloceanibacter sp.]HZP09051.1 bifunctional riboflavin kinase/FAD synthetase [Methyloceanibacter sp.]
MDVVRSWQDVPGSLKGAALAIGNFDGVHRGHQAVLLEAKRIANAEGRRSGAVVFDPHPRAFFAPGQPFFYLTPLPLKLELLAELGLDQTFVLPFTRELSSLSADDFATKVVGEGLGASHVVVGYDFTYGRGRTGTTEGLRAIGRSQGFGVDVVAPVGELGAAFSSSSIRDHLRNGEMREAAEQLGYWWRIRGRVEKGHGRGKILGFPTLNLPLANGQEVAHGIYAMRVYHKGRRYDAAGYVGSSPTFGPGTPALEAYVLDFAGDLYGEDVELEFISKLRGDRAFADGEALAKQMREDCEAARIVLRNIEQDDPMRRFPLGRALEAAALDCREPGC